MSTDVSDLRLRPGALADAAAILAVQAASWRATYPGLVPQRLFPRPDDPERRRFWEDLLLTGRTATRVAVDAAGDVRGFASAGRPRGPYLPADGEIYALYLHPAVQRRGIGRRLLAASAQVLAARGAKRLGLWALATNDDAHRFYGRCGGRRCRRRITVDEDVRLVEVGYVWDPIERAWE